MALFIWSHLIYWFSQFCNYFVFLLKKNLIKKKTHKEYWRIFGCEFTSYINSRSSNFKLCILILHSIVLRVISLRSLCTCIIFTSQIKKLYKAELYDCIYSVLWYANWIWDLEDMRLTISYFIQKWECFAHLK